MENNNESKRKSLMLGEFDVKVILDCLDKELSKELTDWGPVWEKDQSWVQNPSALSVPRYHQTW